jgi:hypothetical protein
MRVAIYARVSTDDGRLSHDRPASLTSSQRNTSAHGLLPQCGRSLAVWIGFSLFDLRNGRVPAGDLDIVTNYSAKYRASKRRDIEYATPSGFGFVFTNDAECLRPAIIPPHGHCGPEMYFAFVGC